jgi:hypothetical protein
MPVYAGIGSRETPPMILAKFSEIGEALAREGWILRSGGADGADRSFESGCDTAQGKKEIYLPWQGFNGSYSLLYPATEEARAIAARFHPAWEILHSGASKLIARNTHQVLGQDCKSPADLIICYTSPHKGGTTQALRIAAEYKIPAMNFFDRMYSLEEIRRYNK